MLKLNLMWWGKTEQIEKLPQSLCTFKYRKVIMHKCPCINALSLVTSSYLNVETEPRMNHVRFNSDIYAWLQLEHLSVDIYAKSIFMKLWPFFNFFIMANTSVTLPSTLRKLETQIWGMWLLI